MSGIHFPPGVVNKPSAALYGIENTCFPMRLTGVRSVHLRPGDVFAACIDGVTEAMDLHGEQDGVGL